MAMTGVWFKLQYAIARIFDKNACGCLFYYAKLELFCTGLLPLA